MRHVPEDELHAYLDQALSRSQCVEIETHMADCGRCRDLRDATAALRDRTTALLGQLTPRTLIIPPPYGTLIERKGLIALPVDWRRRARRAGLWAAGLVAAVGAGWAGRSLLEPRQLAPAPLAFQTPDQPTSIAPVAEVLPQGPSTDFQPSINTIPIAEKTPRFAVQRQPRYRVAEAVVPAPTTQFVSVGLAGRDSTTVSEPAPLIRTEELTPFKRIWRRVEWEDALQIAGSSMPFIEGMPVIGVLLQPGAPGERPTVIVAQQDASGEVIQSIEGPQDKVNELLARQITPDVNRSALTRTPSDYVDVGGSLRRTIRMLTVTGRLSVDSLNALTKIVTIR